MPNTQSIPRPHSQAPAPLSLPSAHCLKSISVIGGFLDGVCLDLTAGLNCIIGGRGTGKTTALELVRYALDALPSRDGNPTERKRIESLVQQNLAGGRVQLQVETKDGLAYTITRSWGEEPIVMTAEGRPTAVSLGNSTLFRADVFSQNEIECIADRTTSQLALIDSFEAQRMAQIDTKVRQLRLALTSNAGQIAPLQGKLAALDEELGTLPGIEEKLKRFSRGDDEGSVEINRAHALKAMRDRERRATDAAAEILQAMSRGLAGLRGQICHQAASLIGPEIAEGPNGPILQEIVGGLSQCGQAVDRLLEQARSEIAGEQAELTRRTTALATVHNEQELAFRAVIEKHEQARGQAAERSQLERLRNDLLGKRRLRNETGEQLRALETDRGNLLTRLSKLQDRRFEVRQEVVERINAALLPAIRVSIVQYGDPQYYRRLLETALRGAKIKHGVVAQNLVNAFWPANLAEAIRQEDRDLLMESAELKAAQAEKVLAALSESEWLFELETVELVDRPRIELLDGDTYKESLCLSTGQKCTSILPILLLDSENPLLVDQPEDNLDNGFIYGTIVESIRKIKSQRQLVFVTHNPNIPVLGDAERVFVLESDGRCGRKVKQGSVDECKELIVTLLEGGEEAFKQRKERYAY